jgi:cytochrome c peroxidase
MSATYPEGQPIALNTPTVFNASLNFRLNWEGKFRSLEEGTEQTLRNPAIMASSADEVVSKLRADPESVRQFRDAYGREPDVAAVLDAIATYERLARLRREAVSTAGLWAKPTRSRRRSFRLPAVQIARLHHLPSGRQCGRQSVSAAWHFSIHWLAGAGAASRSQLAKRRRPLHPISTTAARRPVGGGEEMGIAQLDRVLTEPQIAAIVAFLNTLTGTYRGQAGAAGQRHAAQARRSDENLAGALGVSLLLALLTWLLLRGIDTNAPAYAMTLRPSTITRSPRPLSIATSCRREPVCFATMTACQRAAQAMRDAVTRLRSHAQMSASTSGPVDRLAARSLQQEELMERFKTSNALLQNSLSYVGLLSTSPAFRAQDAQVAPATGALAAAISLSVARHIARRRQGAAAADRPVCGAAPGFGPDAEAARAMLAHARLLYDELPRSMQR